MQAGVAIEFGPPRGDCSIGASWAKPLLSLNA